MLVYRIAQTKYARDLSGFGAQRAGGRWNLKGTPVVYTSQSISLATLEVLVHNPDFIPLKHSLVTIAIENHHIVDIAQLEYNQLKFIANSQIIGDYQFNQKGIKILKVPSVVTPEESNYILNSKTPQSYEITEIEPFVFDSRIMDLIRRK